MRKLLALCLLLASTAAPVNAQSHAITCTRDPNSSVNLRNGPGRNNYVIASIPSNAYVRILSWVWGGDGMRWYNVEYNGLVGWQRSDYLCR
jgi:uncharacterized protein YraI